MDNPTLTTLIVGLFGGGLFSTLATLYFTRRKLQAESQKLKAESSTADADALSKFHELVAKQQTRNDELYAENTALEIKVNDLSRTNEQMRIRLEERDAQLTAATKQLDLLRELAKTAPVTETLKNQLSAMNQIVHNLQHAQAEMQQLMIDREKAYKELFDSTRGLLAKKTAV